MEGSIALEWPVKNVVHSLLHTNCSNRKCEVDTNFTDTFSGFAWQNAEGQAIRHAWVIIKNKLMIKIKAKSDTDWRASDWKLEKCRWRCKERTDAEESRQWTLWAPLQIQKRWVVTMTPTQLAHSLNHMPRTHTNTHTLIHTEEHQGKDTWVTRTPRSMMCN